MYYKIINVPQFQEVECELMDDGTHLRDVVTQAVQVAALPTKLPADAEASIHKIRLISNDTTFEVQNKSRKNLIKGKFLPTTDNYNLKHKDIFPNGPLLQVTEFSNNSQLHTMTSPRSSFISTNSSSTSGVSSGGSFATLPSQ